MRISRWVAPVILFFSIAATSEAQFPPGGLGQRLPGQRGGLGNLTELRQRAMDRLKTQLEANDEEWKIIAPRLEKVMVLRVDSQGGIGGAIFFFRLPRGFATLLREAGVLDGLGPFAALLDSPVTQAAEGIRDVLADENARGPDVAFSLQEFRKARDKARADLVAAQEDVRQYLTPRQEGILIVNGLLD